MLVMVDIIEDKDMLKAKVIKEKNMVPKVGDTVYVHEEYVHKLRGLGKPSIFDDVVGKRLKVVKTQLIWDTKKTRQAILITVVHPSKSGVAINAFMKTDGKGFQFPDIHMFREALFN